MKRLRIKNVLNAVSLAILWHHGVANANPCAGGVCPWTPVDPPKCNTCPCPAGSAMGGGGDKTPTLVSGLGTGALGMPSVTGGVSGGRGGDGGGSGIGAGLGRGGDGSSGGGPSFGGCRLCNDTQIGGMATWSVSEPWLSLHIEDQPINYLPARSGPVTWNLSYRQLQEVKEYPNIFGLGTNWSL
jgi:hypothetical protein